MRCPSCEIKLRSGSSGGKPLHRCEECRGIFMSLEVLEALLKVLVKKEGGEPVEPGEIVDYLRLHGRMLKATRPCPDCRRDMVKKNYPAMARTALDFCWPCQAVWLDKGELGKVSRLKTEKRDAPGTGEKGKAAPKRKGLRTVRDLNRELSSIHQTVLPSRRAREEARQIAGFLGAYRNAKRKARRRRRKRPKDKE